MAGIRKRRLDAVVVELEKIGLVPTAAFSVKIGCRHEPRHAISIAGPGFDFEVGFESGSVYGGSAGSDTAGIRTPAGKWIAYEDATTAGWARRLAERVAEVSKLGGGAG